MSEGIVAEGVTKRYGDTVALDEVSVAVDAGEVFGLIGPNGAGKTTLVRALTGTTPVEGDVRVLGRPPSNLDEQRIGLLPQSFSPAARLTGRELVSYYAGLYDRARDVQTVLDGVGMAQDADTWYESLSGGQQRRICVASALVNDPDVLFLDEPTTGIDPVGRRALWDLLDDLADAGTTVFLTSHSMGEVERLADRVGMLRDGRLVAVGSPDSLITAHGGASRLVVHTDANVDAFVDEAFEVESSTDGLVFDGVGPGDISAVIRLLDDAGVTYDSLVWKQPGLEAVYLSLTGDQFVSHGSEQSGGSVE